MPESDVHSDNLLQKGTIVCQCCTNKSRKSLKLNDSNSNNDIVSNKKRLLIVMNPM
jgi:hypothetical protein